MGNVLLNAAMSDMERAFSKQTGNVVRDVVDEWGRILV